MKFKGKNINVSLQNDFYDKNMLKEEIALGIWEMNTELRTVCKTQSGRFLFLFFLKAQQDKNRVNVNSTAQLR